MAGEARSVRVFDQHIVRAARPPLESQPPLFVDPNVPGPVVLFQVVPRGRLHEIHCRRRVELSKFALCHALDIDKPPTFASREKHLCIAARKGLD